MFVPFLFSSTGSSALLSSVGSVHFASGATVRAAVQQPRRSLTNCDFLSSRRYGELPVAERLRVAWLAGTLFFIIGGYWLLRSLKDPIVSTIVGVEYIPKCKMVSLVVVFALVFVYNKLLDIFPKHRLFYIVGGFYALAFAVIAQLLADPVIGLANTNADPRRLLGWVSYCAIESFGSICVSLFWAFVNSTMNFEGAKSAYGLIIAGAQVRRLRALSARMQAAAEMSNAQYADALPVGLAAHEPRLPTLASTLHDRM
jgi:ATP/ADP translocase